MMQAKFCPPANGLIITSGPLCHHEVTTSRVRSKFPIPWWRTHIYTVMHLLCECVSPMQTQIALVNVPGQRAVPRTPTQTQTVWWTCMRRRSQMPFATGQKAANYWYNAACCQNEHRNKRNH